MPPTTFELLCAVLIALLIGVAMIFSGYRWFLVILPIFGFVAGFGLGADTMHALFGYQMFATVTSWVVGFIVGAVFAVLSYFFYLFGVAIFAGAVGYYLAMGLMLGLGINIFNFIPWLIGIVAAVALAFVVLRFNVQKYVIIIGTSLAGAGVVIASLLYAFGKYNLTELASLAVKVAISANWLWWLTFVVLAGFGIYTQIVTTRTFVLVTPENKL
jgi:hypothetical protein